MSKKKNNWGVLFFILLVLQSIVFEMYFAIRNERHMTDLFFRLVFYFVFSPITSIFLAVTLNKIVSFNFKISPILIILIGVTTSVSIYNIERINSFSKLIYWASNTNESEVSFSIELRQNKSYELKIFSLVDGHKYHSGKYNIINGEIILYKVGKYGNEIGLGNECLKIVLNMHSNVTKIKSCNGSEIRNLEILKNDLKYNRS